MKEFRTRNQEENNNTEEELQVGKVVEEEEEGRQQWSNPIEFLLSCIAMSVRVVTIMKLLLFHVSRYNLGGPWQRLAVPLHSLREWWRRLSHPLHCCEFPRLLKGRRPLCLLQVLMLIGRPLYFMELVMGQFSSASSVKVPQSLDLFLGETTDKPLGKPF